VGRSETAVPAADACVWIEAKRVVNPINENRVILLVNELAVGPKATEETQEILGSLINFNSAVWENYRGAASTEPGIIPKPKRPLFDFTHRV
jgi:hypothetical protein